MAPIKAFMSHSSVDKPFVERLARDLRTREGIDAWLDQWEIQPGDRIPTRLEEGLNSAGVFILILSPRSVNSQWVSHEKDVWLMSQIEEEVRAKQESRLPNRRLIPVLYQDCEKPAFLKPLLHVSMNDQNYEEGFGALVRGIRGESGKPPLKGEESAVAGTSIPSPPMQAAPNVAPRVLAFNLLKRLLLAQFDEVIFLYGVDEAQLPMNVAQVQRARDVIKFAEQKEGDSLAELLNTIYQVVPHLGEYSPSSPSSTDQQPIAEARLPDNTQKDDAEIEYRSRVESYVNRTPLSETYSGIYKIHRISLEKSRKDLGLTIDKAKEIEGDVLQSRYDRHQKYKENLQSYEAALKEVSELEDSWSHENLSNLEEFKNELRLDNRDAELLSLYYKLASHLKVKDWQTADKTTKDFLVRAANLQRDGFYSEEDFRKIPCQALRQLDELWVVHSNGHFGCSVQLSIWEESPKKDFWNLFTQLGWVARSEEGVIVFKHIYNLYSDRSAPKGLLPVLVVYEPGPGGGREAYLYKIQQCFKNGSNLGTSSPASLPSSTDQKPIDLTALTSNQRKEFREAVISAFPDPFQLELMIEDELGESLNLITSEQPDYRLAVRNLIKWAEAHGRVQELLDGALKANPGNPKLKKFASMVSD